MVNLFYLNYRLEQQRRNALFFFSFQHQDSRQLISVDAVPFIAGEIKVIDILIKVTWCLSFIMLNVLDEFRKVWDTRRR